jgi:hypothetical protein
VIPSVVIPAKAGIHFDFVFGGHADKQQQNQNGSQLSLG